MTWNGLPLTLRKEGKSDRLFNAHGATPPTTKYWGSGDGVYYQNLPSTLKEKMPLYGNQEVNTKEANNLYLPTKTMVYLFRQPRWSGVDLNGWKYVSTGSYLSLYGNDIQMYTKELAAGNHIIDNMSAMYLFDPDY